MHRGIVLLAATLAAAFLHVTEVAAQDWPAKPLRVLVPYGPGSPPDVTTRLVADRMAGALGRPIVVENKPGAAGLVSMTELMKQPADGYTLLTMITPLLVAPALMRDPSLDAVRDLAPVGQYLWSFSVLVTSPGAEQRGVPALVDAIRAKPRQFSFASGGHGTPAHLAGELFNQSYGLDAVHVPYNQFPQAIADLTSGRVSFMFLTNTVAVPNITSGKLRAIGVASPRRLPTLPDVPTLVEQGFTDFDVRTWDGLVVRAGTPPALVARLNQALAAAVATPELRERFTQLGLEPVSESPEQFGALLRRDHERWNAVVRKGNIKID